MQPTLAENQIVLILRRPFAGRPDPENVVTTEYQGETIVKRIAARGPCAVFWDTNSFWTNSSEETGDTALNTVPAISFIRQQSERTLAENEVFLLGDNLSASVDSRSFGPLPIDAITGRVLAVIYPFQALQAVR